PPPAADVQHPPDHQRVVDEKPSAPVESDHLVGLPSSFTVRGCLTPAVVKLISANYMRDQREAGNCPNYSRGPVPPHSSSRKRKDESANCVPHDGQPDGDPG